ncbi:hypothetical protein K438DRAFT_1775160 [Mycena galopus ATCC 62051]|nr:hypothetical protein K438DRAFT_1775160 [Mycena galopus ATCC 62051]
MDDNEERKGRRMNVAEKPGHCGPEVQWWSAAELNTRLAGDDKTGRWSPKELGRTLVDHDSCAVKEIQGYKVSSVEPLRVGPAQRLQIELNTMKRSRLTKIVDIDSYMEHDDRKSRRALVSLAGIDQNALKFDKKRARTAIPACQRLSELDTARKFEAVTILLGRE